MRRVKKSGITVLAVGAALTVAAIALGGDFMLLLSLQPYFVFGLLVVFLVAFLNTRREFASSGGRDRLCLQFVQVLASCIVCIGLLLTLISLARTMWFASCRIRFNLGDVMVSVLPFLYCLAIAEVACPALVEHFGCRVQRGEHPPSDNETGSA